MKHVYVFRHGETEWNLQRRLQGHSDISLNSTGEEQARALLKSQKIPLELFKNIYVSDLKRAQETAQIATNYSLNLMVDTRLREVSLGDFEGCTHEEVISKFGKSEWDRWYDFDFNNWNQKIPGGECKNQLKERSAAFIIELLSTSDQLDFLICTHGFLIRTLQSHLLQIPQQRTPLNCELMCWEFDLSLINDSEFLSAAEKLQKCFTKQTILFPTEVVV